MSLIEKLFIKYNIKIAPLILKSITIMNYVTFEYQIMGIGKWIAATVSKDIATKLAAEYTAYGWPVKIS